MGDAPKDKLIDDYIMNRLNEQEHQAFLTQLDQDPELQKAVQVRKVLIEQIKTVGNLQLKDKILNIQAKVEAKEKRVSRIRFIRIAVGIAAAIALLIIGSQWINAPSHQDLFAQNYEAYNLPFGNRSQTNDRAVYDAGALYLRGNYAEALPLLEQLDAAGKSDDRVSLAIAICHLELKDYSKALSTLQQISNQKESSYQEQVQWYTALTHLQLEQVKESKTILQDLSTSSKTYSKEAKVLLDELK